MRARFRRALRRFPLAALLTVAVSISWAQFGIPKLKVPKIKVPGLEKTKVPGLDSILRGEPPVTTSFSDALTGLSFLDGYEPALLRPLGDERRAPDGSFLVGPGAYYLDAQSYCLHAGTYAPGKGEGYLYAPLKGPKSNIVRNILQRSVQHAEIAQRDIQVLLWAVIARTNFSNMSRELQATAAQLLTPEELFELNGGALGLIPAGARNQVFGGLSGPVRQVLEAENEIRRLLAEPVTSFDELERAAVLIGDPPDTGPTTPRGRWSYHPDGYFVNFHPSGYSETRVNLIVPDRFAVDYDDSGRIVRITDRYGNFIETAYDDALGAVEVAPGVRAHAFKSIRFGRPFAPGDEPFERRWENTGWTLVGVPTDGGPVTGVSASARMPDVVSRYEAALRRAEEAKSVLGALTTNADTTGNVLEHESMTRLLNRQQHASGIRDAVAGDFGDEEEL